MKKNLLAGLMVVAIIIGFAPLVEAISITQSFFNDWTIDVYTDNGYTAARKWEYQNYNASAEQLDSVELTIDITVSEMTAGDDFSYRTSFFTGWNPAEYQFYKEGLYKNVVNKGLNIKLDYFFTSPSDLAKWTNPKYGLEGDYYFESTTWKNSHKVSVSTQLTFNEAVPVPEPATILLFCTGLAGVLAARVRKKSNA